jgi:hypothetical protein
MCLTTVKTAITKLDQLLLVALAKQQGTAVTK